MATADIDQRQIQSSRNRKFSKLSYHSLRHSFSSALANVGISADVRMKLTGHKIFMYINVIHTFNWNRSVRRSHYCQSSLAKFVKS
jgi:integrase